MIRVGIAGVGFMGWIHWLAYQQVDGVQVTAICERDEKRLSGDWTDIKGNFGPPGETVDLTGVGTFRDLEAMVQDSELDLIDICLPPSLHVQAIELAARAGKQVFCEKPLALSLADCDRANQACQAAGVQLLVGHVLPFFPEYRFAREVIDSGQYGQVVGGHFTRIISDPTWLADFYDPDRVGGPLIDLHIHDAHWIRLLFGRPLEVCSTGRMRGEVVSYCDSLFRFENPERVVSSRTGVIDQQGRPFLHGFEIQLEQATMQFEFGALAVGSEASPLKLFTPDGQVERPDIGDGDPLRGFEAEIREVVRSIESGQPSAILGGTLARDAIEICLAEAESVRQRTSVRLPSGD